MATDLIPDDVRQFILDNIDSVAQLEGLLLLRSETESEWSVAAIAQRLFITEQQAADLLEQLRAQGFLAIEEGKSPKYRYQPNSPVLKQMVDRVAEIYSKYLVPVTNLIHSKPQTKVQQFADAFKLRKRRDK